MREGDDEMTYFLLFRHAHLVLSNLVALPEWKKQAAEFRAIEREVEQNLKTLDVLKPRINRRYEEFAKTAKARQARREEEVAKRKLPQTSFLQEQEQGQTANQIQQLRGQEHADLAAKLAGQEFSKRGSGRRSYPTGLSQQSEQDDLASGMQAIRNKVDLSSVLPYSATESQPRAQLTHPGFSYPTVPLTQQAQLKPQDIAQIPLPPASLARPPVLPPKPSRSTAIRSNLPPRPDKVAGPAITSNSDTEPTYSFATEARLENGTPLRTMFVPPTLRTTFLRLAHQNTGKNLETCGFLAGTLRANALFVSTLIVPAQTATSDTCEMTDESDLFDYVDQHELMILGWIHTHPTQTCFMSSRDLHTHSGYQMMLAESIAVVCAPSKGDTSHGGEWGVYRLTDPPGKMAILQCDKPGIFHPHDVDDIYTNAMRPGHVMEISGMDFEIVDLRHSN